MLSAAEFYNLQKGKKNNKKTAQVESTIAVVNKLANTVNADAKKMVAQQMSQINQNSTLSSKTKKKNKKNRRNKNTKMEKLNTEHVSKVTPEVTPVTVVPEEENKKKQKNKRKRDGKHQEKTVSSAKRSKVSSKDQIESEDEDQKAVPELVECDDSDAIEVESIGDEVSSDENSDESNDDAEDKFDDGAPINPMEEGGALMELLTSPIGLDAFAEDYFGRKPVHFDAEESRQNFSCLLDLSEVDTWLAKEHLMIGQDIEYTWPYKEPPKPTLLKSGRAFRAAVWSQFKMGCAIRIKAPERFSERLGGSLHLMSEYIRGPISSDLVYITSAFKRFHAPDSNADIFILQLEGNSNIIIQGSIDLEKDEKKWPSTVSMKPGDILYLPRPFSYSQMVPAGKDGDHAIQLHIFHHAPAIVNSFLHKFKKICPGALPGKQTSLFRAVISMLMTSRPKNSIPDFFMPLDSEALKSMLGRQKDDEKKKTELQSLLDEIAIELSRRSPAPVLHPTEAECHISEQGEMWLDPNQNIPSDDDDDGDEDGSISESNDEEPQPPEAPHICGRVAFGVELEPDTQVRILRRSVAHLCTNGKKIRICHSLSNSHNPAVINEPISVPFFEKHMAILKRLFEIYPEPIAINDLPGASIDEKMKVVDKLYEAGVVITNERLPPCPWDDSDDESSEAEQDADEDKMESE